MGSQQQGAGVPSTSPSAPSSSSSSARVGDIFVQAGAAFNTLGELTAQLSSAQKGGGAAAAGGGVGAKWSEEEVEMLQRAVSNFAADLANISTRIKGKMVGQIRTTLRKKAFDEAGLPQVTAVSPAPASPTKQQQQQQQSLLAPKQPAAPAPSSDVTLNALNAGAGDDVDVEGGGGQMDL